MYTRKRLHLMGAILFGALFFSIVLPGHSTSDNTEARPYYGLSDEQASGVAGYACEEDLIEVMFKWESRVRLRRGAPVDLTSNAMDGVDGVLERIAWHEWSRTCGISEERLDEFQSRGEANTGKPVYNLNNIYRLYIPKGLDIWQICRDLEKLPGIMTARPVPKPPPLPVNDYEYLQGYLDSAGSSPSGIDAEYAWTQPGGTGTGITICDIEYGWHYIHADIPKAVGSQINPNPITLPPNEGDCHGTAVLGVIVSDPNGWGTTGMCYGADVKTCGAYYFHGNPPNYYWNPAGAIAFAMDSVSAGDIILLEQQWDYLDTTTFWTDLIPVEWYTDTFPNPQSNNAVYAAIVNAVSNGIHVIEAGGNGGAPTPNTGYNTDNLTWQPNSGAIIVGAGHTQGTGDLHRVGYSSYGSRYDVQGWGLDVVTCGYGDLFSAGGKDSFYTAIFAGTSSSSATVAGAVACCMGYALQQGWDLSALTPALIRDVLKNTGTPQVDPHIWGHIGPRPNLRAAFGELAALADVTTSAFTSTRNTYGVAWGDYDNDKDLDIYLSNNFFANNLLRNDGGGVFTDVTTAPLNDAETGAGVAWGDYDNDGDLDLYCVKASVANHPNKLFRNDGGGTFTDVTPTIMADTGWGHSMGWGDYDEDGDIDLFFTSDHYYGDGNKLCRNDGGGTFTDVTNKDLAGSMGTEVGMSWVDYDNDGDLDIFLTRYGGAEDNRLFRNDGGVFVKVAPGPLVDASLSMGFAWGDYDNDGDLDVYIANQDTTANKLIRNDGGGSFTDVTTGPLGDTSASIDAIWGDYDNDADLDLYIVNTNNWPNKLLRNDGGGTFTDVTTAAMGDTMWSKGAAWGDYDNDGDIDLAMANYNQSGNKLLENRIGTKNHWFHIHLSGRITSNRDGIGARVRVVAGGISQIREISGGGGLYCQNSLTAEFGLGSATNVDTLEIRWPTSAKEIQIWTNLPVDTLMYINQPGEYVCGDANNDDNINLLDILYLIDFLYGNPLGPPPDPMEAGDANADGNVNLLDILYLIDFLYGSPQGPDPLCP
ncbi:MAG: VCBS repeat-containing protein [Planctomycetota bacterium]|nr:MAG: VCBS repeat-containing protein [Planctomycetota bacterium]